MLLGACMVCPTLRGELEQLRVDFEVLSAPTDTCENFLTLRMQLVDRDATIKKLEKAAPVFPSLDCDTCAAQTVVLEDLRVQVLSLQDDNCRLREVLSWVYARQPQLEMIIESTKRAEGDMSGFGFGSAEHRVRRVPQLRSKLLLPHQVSLLMGFTMSHPRLPQRSSTGQLLAAIIYLFRRPIPR